MTISEQHIKQMQEWLAEANEDWDVDAAIELPGINWIRVRSVQQEGDLLRIVYQHIGTIPYLRSEETSELLCSSESVRGVRREPSWEWRLKKRANSDSDLPF